MTDEAKALVALQRAAGLKTMPTPLTHDLRIAVSGKGPRAYEWQDKPHRLLYDACAAIETQAREIERLRSTLGAALNIIDRAYRKYGTEFDAEDTAKAIAARAALAGDEP